MGLVVHCFQSEAEIAKIMFVVAQNCTVDYWDGTRPSVRDSNSSYVVFKVYGNGRVPSKCEYMYSIVLQLVDELDT